MGSPACCSQTHTMIFLLVLISSGLASPIEYEAKNAELRALLESGGPADIGGSWTPNLTPEVKAATKFFIDQFNTVELGGLEQLQADQIANAYIDDTEDVAIAKAAHMTAVEEAEAAVSMEATEVKMPVAAEVKMAMPVVYQQQPLVYYQIPHYMPYSLYGR